MPSLYVHVPFCRKKCSYCAFYSLPLDPTLISCYLQGVTQETSLRSKEASTGVSSLFLGGGTPTALGIRELDQLLDTIDRGYRGKPAEKCSGDLLEEQADQPGIPAPEKTVEKTAEANPGTLTAEKLAVLCSYGINRISLGAQSFNDQMLKGIGRIHRAEDIRLGVELIRKAGIENLNLDLIFGLPGQTLLDWRNTLRQAVQLAPEHLSIYALTLEENTPLGRKFSERAGSPAKALGENYPGLPDDDLQADMYEWAVGYLQDNGYKRYEISNFARPGFECRHNLAYWQGEAYLGIGPGAVSCLEGIRTKNVEDLPKYWERLQAGRPAFDPAETEVLTRNQLISEYMMLGLRTAEGIDLLAFKHKFKTAVQDIYDRQLANYIDRKILILDKTKLRINPAYLFVANSILQEFIL